MASYFLDTNVIWHTIKLAVLQTYLSEEKQIDKKQPVEKTPKSKRPRSKLRRNLFSDVDTANLRQNHAVLSAS